MAARCFRTDKHHHTALAVHVVIDPFFDRGLALPLDLFPRIRGAKSLPFKSTDVAHLLGAPKIVREVETEENAPRHTAPFCSPAFYKPSLRFRTEERRVGNESVSTGRSWG